MDKAREGLFLSKMNGGDAKQAWRLLNSNRDSAYKKKYRRPDIEIPLCIKAGDVKGGIMLLEKYYNSPETRKDRKKGQIYRSLLQFLSEKKAASGLLCNEMLENRLPRSDVMACINRLKTVDSHAFKQVSRRVKRLHPAWFNKQPSRRPKTVIADPDALLAFKAFENKDYSSALDLSIRALEQQNEKRSDLITVAAWSAFHLDKWSEAEKWFKAGLSLDSHNEDMLAGLCWSLIRQDKCAECAQFLSASQRSLSVSLKKPMLEASRCAGMKEYNSKKWGDAVHWFETFLEISPHDTDIQEMLAWSYYKAERWDDAERIFRNLLAQDTRKEWITAEARCLKMQGREQELKEIFDRYYQDSCRSGQLSEFLYAAGIEYDNVCRFAGCENYLAAGIRYRNRSGDFGQGRLDDWYLPALYARKRLSNRIVFMADGGLRHVSNHRHSDDFKDAYFSFLFQESDTLNLFAGAGFTGSGSLIGPRSLWHAGGSVNTDKGRFTLTAYRSTVDDSLLSISGSKAGHNNGIVCSESDCKCDSEHCKWNQPGACKEFGGVSRTGAYIEWSGNAGRVNLNALLDFEELTGTKVRRNHKYLANFSAGSSFAVPYGYRHLLQPIWAGMYATWFRYERNLNYYTCGNGGYFSPRSFIGAGPVINIRTVEGKCWIASLDMSASVVNYIEDDGWQYPNRHGNSRGCQYDGRSLNLIGYGVHGRGAWRLNSYMAIEARGGVERGADFTEWGAALNLIIYPDKVAGMFFQGLPEMMPWLP